MLTNDSTKSRLLKLLGSGIAPAQAASACGVTESYVSQCMAEEEFKNEVLELRYASLQKYNERDTNIDSLEDTLIEKIKDLIPLMTRPMEAIKAFQVINAAKRRGQSAPESIVNQQTIVQINMPVSLINKFRVNSTNQVVSVGNQNLVTMQSGTLLKRLEKEGEQNEQLAQRDLALSTSSRG